MNCREFEDQVMALAGDRLIDATVRQQALRHAAGCGACAARFRDERMLAAGLHDYAESTEGEAAPAHVKQALRTAFAQRITPEDRPAPLTNAGEVFRPMPLHARHWRWRALAAAAALLLVALAAEFWLRGQGPMRDDVIVTGPPTPDVTQNVSTTAPPAPKVARQLAKPPARRSPRIPARQRRFDVPVANEREVATGYIPLTYSTDNNAAKDGLVVRVEVARSSLIAMGLPLNIERANDRVKADVIMGVDGVPLAIRLIQ